LLYKFLGDRPKTETTGIISLFWWQI